MNGGCVMDCLRRICHGIRCGCVCEFHGDKVDGKIKTRGAEAIDSSSPIDITTNPPIEDEVISLGNIDLSESTSRNCDLTDGGEGFIDDEHFK